MNQQALSFALAQSYKINQQVYETKYPDLDFARLVYVDTSGPEWAPGVLTYTSDVTGKANWQSGYAKDVPLADVSQGATTRTFEMAAIGYQWNIEEINTALNVAGASLPDRRAKAARLAYQQFMYDLVVHGSAEKNMSGLINYKGVTVINAPNDGTNSSRVWVDAQGVGQKTPAQIVRDVNLALMGVAQGTYYVDLADTLLLPYEAHTYIAQTPYSPTTMETILSFIKRNNIYTLTTGNELTIRTVAQLSTAGAGDKGRLAAYKNDENTIKLHLPMPHRFLPLWQDGPMNFTVPGVFRTGGLEILNTKAMRYVDNISEPLAI